MLDGNADPESIIRSILKIAKLHVEKYRRKSSSEADDRIKDEILKDLEKKNDIETAFDFGFLLGATQASELPPFGQILQILFQACLLSLYLGKGEEETVRELMSVFKESERDHFMMYGR